MLAGSRAGSGAGSVVLACCKAVMLAHMRAHMLPCGDVYMARSKRHNCFAKTRSLLVNFPWRHGQICEFMLDRWEFFLGLILIISFHG